MISRPSAVISFIAVALAIATPAIADKVKKRDTIASLEDKTVEIRPGQDHCR